MGRISKKYLIGQYLIKIKEHHERQEVQIPEIIRIYINMIAEEITGITTFLRRGREEFDEKDQEKIDKITNI